MDANTGIDVGVVGIIVVRNWVYGSLPGSGVVDGCSTSQKINSHTTFVTHALHKGEPSGEEAFRYLRRNITTLYREASASKYNVLEY